MGHRINGIVAAHGPLTAVARDVANASVCRLGLGFGFLPLMEEVASLDDLSAALQGLCLLTAPMASWAVEQSKNFPIAYIETEYFGGIGRQSAAVWRNGTLVFGPEQTGNEDAATPLLDGAINRAVRLLGVNRGNACDEFEALGLNKYRSNEDWIKSYREG